MISCFSLLLFSTSSDTFRLVTGGKTTTDDGVEDDSCWDDDGDDPLGWDPADFAGSMGGIGIEHLHASREV